MNIFSDGGARGNPGPAACAFVIVDDDEKVLHQESKYLNITTNNVAEYQGVVLALTWLIEKLSTTHYQLPINFYLDSELVVKQLGGLYKVKDVKLQILFSLVKSLEQRIKPKIIFKHVPRSKNYHADLLVNQELDRKS